MKTNYKFAYITAVDISIDDGPGINEREFVKILLKDHSNSVVCILPKPLMPNVFFDQQIRYITNHRGHHPFYFLLYCIDLIYKVVLLNRKLHFDAIILRVDIFPLAEIILSLFLKTKFLLKTLAGGTYRASKIVRVATRVSSPFRDWIITRALGGDTVGVTSKEWILRTYRISENSIEIIPNGVNTDLFYRRTSFELGLPTPSDRFKFLLGYVGALRKISHIDLLIEAVADASLINKVGLLIVGQGPEMESLKRLARQKGLENSVIFAGSVPYVIVPEYLSALDIAVDLTASPVKIGNEIAMASYSQKIPQYLACGLPVIAWDLKDTAYIARERLGKLVTMNSPKELVAAIQSLCSWIEHEKETVQMHCRHYAETELSIERLTHRRVAFWEKSVASN